jgi:hypothetical protein
MSKILAKREAAQVALCGDPFGALIRLAPAIRRGDGAHRAAEFVLVAGLQLVAGIDPGRLPFALLADGKSEVLRVARVERCPWGLQALGEVVDVWSVRTG